MEVIVTTPQVSNIVAQPSTSNIPSNTSPTIINSSPKVQKEQLTWLRPLLMLLSRVVFFALFQILIASLFALRGSAQPWQVSIGWWPITATLTNLLCLVLLDRFMRLEGLHLRNLYTFDRHSIW